MGKSKKGNLVKPAVKSVLSQDERILRDAEESHEAFYKDTLSMIARIPEKPDGQCLLNLEMMRQSVRDRGYIPKF